MFRQERILDMEAGLNPIRALALLAAAIPAAAQFAGPAILTRGEAPAAMDTPGIDFRPFMELGGVYDTGLTGVAVNSNGQLGSAASPGVTFSGGVSGLHSWKRTKVGLDYHGSLYHYTQTTYYDGTDAIAPAGRIAPVHAPHNAGVEGERRPVLAELRPAQPVADCAVRFIRQLYTKQRLLR